MAQHKLITIPKSPTGIQGLDEILGGGLPKGRPTLVCGGAGSGKTLLAIEFLVHGALQYDEPGVFMSFEETASELVQNVASLGFDLNDLTAHKKLWLEYIRVEPGEIEETGEYDLEGLFVRLEYAINSIGAKRATVDTVESLFAGLQNPAVLRAELRRLFRWLKDKGMTTIITGERGENSLTRLGLEAYISDCVIFLDHRVTEQVSTRRLRVVKYRGTTHGTNEYPFLIDEEGISILPITSLSLTKPVSNERISSGIPDLDAMLGGQGYYRGSTVLVCGTAGTGKSSLAAHFVEAACRRGERCLYFALEESASQIIRNMRSIGIDLAPWVDQGLLLFHATRPTTHGLEMHLVTTIKTIQQFAPAVVVIDPINAFIMGDNALQTQLMLNRLVDFLKTNAVTALFTSLTSDGGSLETSEVAISSLIDTWLLLRDIETGGERNRGLYIIKSRGMAHSNQIREFQLTDHGIKLMDVYIGPGGVLTGSARLAQEARDQAAEVLRQQEVERLQFDLECRRAAMEAQVAALQAEFEAERTRALNLIQQEQARQVLSAQDRVNMKHSRKADT